MSTFQNLLWVYGMACLSVRFPSLKFCPSPPLILSNGGTTDLNWPIPKGAQATLLKKRLFIIIIIYLFIGMSYFCSRLITVICNKNDGEWIGELINCLSLLIKEDQNLTHSANWIASKTATRYFRTHAAQQAPDAVGVYTKSVDQTCILNGKVFIKWNTCICNLWMNYVLVKSGKDIFFNQKANDAWGNFLSNEKPGETRG